MPSSVQIISMAATADFNFLAFPFEIRKHVYVSMLAGQMVHCCPDEKHVHHPPATDKDTPEDHFFDGFMQCSSTCYESLSDQDKFLSGEVRWTNTARPAACLPSPSDVLSFLLSCKIVWNEMEPLLWRYMTFCIGLPQFAGFYERFLAPERPGHPITTPRAQLLQRISLALIQDINLANSLNTDSRFRHVSGLWTVRTSRREAIGHLKEQCTSLQHLIGLVDGTAFAEALGAGGMVVRFEDSLTLLQFKHLKSFKLMVHGPIDRADNEITYPSAPATHPMKLALDATESTLVEILTRKREPSRDLPPEGISPTDPDFVWLRKFYETDAEGDPRLTELVLKTRLCLEKRGITTLPVADANF